jgi:MerR family transcriptional regulator, thiopeptide resistance regulator
MRYTVKQLSRLAGITTRTLHYYDEVGLLRPAAYGENGYRYYDGQDALRLQQILFYRELDFSLGQIKAILDRPDFDLLTALEGHKRGLHERVLRLNRLIATVDKTIQHIQGEIEMAQADFYKGFDEAQQKTRFDEAEQRWGESVSESRKQWNAYTPAEKNDFIARMHEITAGAAANAEKGPTSPEVQVWIARWHEFIDQYCYPCSLEIFEALGHGYTADPAFRESYEKVRPGLAELMEQAMVYYCEEKRRGRD